MILLLLIIITSRRRRRANGFDKHNNVIVLLLMQFDIVIVYKYLDLFSLFFFFVTFNAHLMNVCFNF